jgi:hypothetical protein
MDRRDFINLSALAATGIGLSGINAKANKVVPSQTNHLLQLSKECSWKIYGDGSFDIIAGTLMLKGCYPSFVGKNFYPLSITVNKDDNNAKIDYRLDGGSLIINLTKDLDSLVLQTTLRGFTLAPHWVNPIANAKLIGANRFFKQGLGFGGPSGIFPIKKPVKVQNEGLFEDVWSYESYLTSGFIAEDNVTLALGAYKHSDFLQRSKVYNQQNRYGLVDRHLESDEVLYEAGFATENINIRQNELNLPDLHIVCGADPFTTFQTLARNIALNCGARVSKPTSYHWCSWYEYTNNFDSVKLHDFLKGIKSIKPEIPIKAVQIDDGYCINGDWLEINDKFPGGLKAAFSKIRENGYNAGIWIAPFMVRSISNTFKNHPDWVIRDFEGKPVPEWVRDGEEWYYLDTSNPEALNYLRLVFRTMKEWGATYFKTDFLDWGLKDSVLFKRYKSGKTSIQYFTDVLKVIREEIGEESFWLGCIAPFPPMIGYVDAIRVSNDVGDSWSEGGVGNMFQESFHDQYFNNIFWQNDPDVLYLRNFNVSYTDEEIHSIALWDGILGGVVNTSDRFHTLASERLKLWRFIQPANDKAISFMPFWAEKKQLYITVRPIPGRKAWAILMVNTEDKDQAEDLLMKNLIGKDSAYLFEWNRSSNEVLGMLSSVNCQLKPHSCKLYYASEVNIQPDSDLALSGIKIRGLN